MKFLPAALLGFLALAGALVDAERVTTTLRKYEPPEVEKVGDKFVADARNYAWRTEAEGSEARAATSEIRAKVANKNAQAAKGAATAATATNAQYVPPTVANMQAAQAELAAALQHEAETKKVLEETHAKAYAAAKASAQAKVNQLKAEAAAYYAQLLAKLAALANPPKNPAAEAAAKAAMPYFKAQLHTTVMVLNYNLKANELVTVAKSEVALAHKMAGQANYDQAAGNAEMALRKMIMAHGLIGDAQLKEDQAKKVYKLARELNQNIPAYANAAQQAAVAVLATFSGLQLDKEGEPGRSDDHPHQPAAAQKPMRGNPFQKKQASALQKPAPQAAQAEEKAEEKAEEMKPGDKMWSRPPSKEELKRAADGLDNVEKNLGELSTMKADATDAVMKLQHSLEKSGAYTPPKH